jgi:hypothetical protein
MIMQSAILVIAFIVLAVLALKFLGGMVKKVISMALFIISAVLAYHWLTGSDFLGIAGFFTALLP